MKPKYPARACVKLIRAYQKVLSPILGGRCRFYPTCSEYAVQCFEFYGFFRALGKSAYRILRCNPLSNGYMDPAVPESDAGGKSIRK